MRGTIVQVSVSRGGIPKRAVASCRITTAGLEGDSWAHPQFHGGPAQAILLIAEEILTKLQRDGFPLFPGALGENLTTRGLDPKLWRIGQTYRAGSARIQLTKNRVPCNTIKIYGGTIGRAIYDNRVRHGDVTSPVWGYSGMYARVLQEGAASPGDVIELESESC